MEESPTNILFRPLQVGATTLPNRIAMAPMTREFARNGVHDPRAVDYYVRRAQGGVGLLISEGSPPPLPEAPWRATLPGFDSEAALEPWRQIASGVRAAGSHMLIQLWHGGLQRDAATSARPDVPSIGPSGVFPVSREDDPTQTELRPMGQEMTIQDIERTIDGFARAAKICQDLGFSGVELHAAHGYLFDQFFWTGTNLRTDRYGGSVENRTRLAVETVQEIRRRTGPDFLISLRISQFKPPLYTVRLVETPQELGAFLEPLAASGIDLIHASTRRYWVPEFEGSELNLAGWAKKLTGLPTISVGSVALATGFDPRKGAGRQSEIAAIDPLLERMERGEFDIIAVGRSLLANPNWARIVREQGVDALAPFDQTALNELA